MSTLSSIENFIDSQEQERMYIHEDFREYGDYGAIRSAVVRLCDRKILKRVCQGVYIRLSSEDYQPDAISIASEIARKTKASIEIKEDVKLDNGRIVSFYTNGSTRSIITSSGTTIKFIHTELVK